MREGLAGPCSVRVDSNIPELPVLFGIVQGLGCELRTLI